MDMPLAKDLWKEHKFGWIGKLLWNKKGIPLEFFAHKTRPIFFSLLGFNDRKLFLASYVQEKNKAEVVLYSFHDDINIDPLPKAQKELEMVTFYSRQKRC